MEEVKPKQSVLPLFLLLAYILSVAVGIEAINSVWGNMLPVSPEEFWGEGSGSGKMRAPRSEFQHILALFGTWVYLLSILGIVGFVRQIARTTNKAARIFYGVCAALCLAILVRFCYLGVFSVGWGQFVG